MSLIAFPFDGVEISSRDWRNFQTRFLTNMTSFARHSGVIYSPAVEGFKVSRVSSTRVSVTGGFAWVSGMPVFQDTGVNLDVAAAHATYTRYDYVVIRVDFLSKTATLAVKQGTPASSPAAPALDKSGSPYFEIPLALLTIAPGSGISSVGERREFISGASSMIRRVRNVSSAELRPGDIVSWDSFSPIDVKPSTTAGDKWTAGAIASVIPPGEYGLLTERGIGLVKLGENLGVNSRVAASSTSGVGRTHPVNWFATLLESGSSGSVVRAWIDTTRLVEPLITLNTSNQSTTIASHSYINGLSDTFFLRWGGRVMFSAWIQASVTSGGTLYFRLQLDGGTKEMLRVSADRPGPTFQQATLIFDQVHAGQHTAGLTWAVSSGATGNLPTGTVQILTL